MEEWELSKENVLPLKQGRKAVNLSAALQPTNTDQSQIIMAEKQAFETELRSYCGEDPLDPWYRYFKWTLQNFPQGGKCSNMSTLADRCFQYFDSKTEYYNDHRFVEIWLYMASLSNQPLEFFEFMKDRGIGTLCSQFYEGWAWELEQRGNTKKADIVFQEGLKNNAQPIDRLNRMHKEFQSRVSRMAFQQVTDGQASSVGPATQEQRTALGGLRGRGAHHTVGTRRTGSAKTTIPLQGAVGFSQPLADSRPNSQIQIHHDDGTSRPALPPTSHQYSTLPTSEDRRKENVSKPSIWSNQSVPQRGAMPPPKPAFTIHEDAGEVQNTPHRPPVLDSQVLSDRKREPPASALPFYPEEPKPNTSAMYCKHLVYAGTTEMSFEEIRAIRYNQKKEEKRIEAERAELAARQATFQKELEELNREKEEYRLMIQRQKEELAEQQRQNMLMLEQQREMMQQQQREMMQKQQREMMQQQREMLMNAQRELVHKQPPMSEENRRLSADSEGSISCTQRLTFDDVTATQTGAIPKVLPLKNADSKPVQNSSDSVTPNVSVGGHPSGTDSQPKTPMETRFLEDTSSGNRSLDSNRSGFFPRPYSSRTPKSLVEPSPTVNTKAALADLMGALNESLGHMQLGIVREDQVAEISDSSVKVNSFSHDKAASAFSVVPSTKDPQGPSLRGAFGGQQWDGEIYMDPPAQEQCKKDDSCKENWPPSDYQQFKMERGTLNVLQPSEGIPCDPDSALVVQDVVMEEAHESRGDTDVVNKVDDVTTEGNKVPPGAIPKANRFHDSTLFQTTSLSFSAMSRMASTPFNGGSSLSFAPVSVIKRDRLESDDSFDAGKQKPLPVVGDGKLPQRTNVTLGQDESLEATQYPTQPEEPKVLSPIIETSAEDHRSSSSSSSSSSASQQRGLHLTTLPSIAESTSVREKVSKDLSNVTLRTDNSAHHMTGPRKEAPMSLADELREADPGILKAHDKSVIEVDEMSENINPFSDETKASLLSGLARPLTAYEGYRQMESDLEVDLQLVIDDKLSYIFTKVCGQGAFAKIYMGTPLSADFDDSSAGGTKVLKVQTPPCPWEFYISRTMHERIGALRDRSHVLESLMFADLIVVHPNSSCLITDHHPYGTLLELINIYQRKGERMSESMVALFAIMILDIVDTLHHCKIIHADIKPDNFMIQNIADDTGSSCLIKLIDFGQSIDMSLFPDKTSFTARCITSGFTCVEMKEERPWTYQTDYFGIAGTIHCMLFNSYMKVFKERGLWKTTANFKRSNKCDWKGIFHTLLNVNSCEPSDLINLKEIKEQVDTQRNQKYTLENLKDDLMWELGDCE